MGGPGGPGVGNSWPPGSAVSSEDVRLEVPCRRPDQLPTSESTRPAHGHGWRRWPAPPKPVSSTSSSAAAAAPAATMRIQTAVNRGTLPGRYPAPPGPSKTS